MKNKETLNRIIYLPEYFQGTIGNELNKETGPDILYWNFENKLDDAIKRQIELLLNQILRIFKNRRNERNRYLRSLKYLCTVTQLNLGTIRIKHMITREFLKYLEEKGEVVSQIDAYVLNRYFVELSGRNIKPQSYNNKLREILIFLQYLYVTDNIKQLNIAISFYQMKNYTAVNEIRNLGEKLDMLMAHLVEFPEQLRIMCMVLLFTGIDKGKMFSLKNADFYFENDNSWMRVPDTSRQIPVPDILHYLVMQYAKKNGIGVEEILFLNNGKRFTAGGFQNAVMKQCRKCGILAEEYVFKGTGYQKEFCKKLYQSGTSIQTIRDYMGYGSDEIVKQKIGLYEAELMQKMEDFYKNETVRQVLEEEKERLDQGKLAHIKRKTRDMSLEKQVEIYQGELKRLQLENNRLEKENKKLRKVLEK